VDVRATARATTVRGRTDSAEIVLVVIVRVMIVLVVIVRVMIVLVVIVRVMIVLVVIVLVVIVLVVIVRVMIVLVVIVRVMIVLAVTVPVTTGHARIGRQTGLATTAARARRRAAGAQAMPGAMIVPGRTEIATIGLGASGPARTGTSIVPAATDRPQDLGMIAHARTGRPTSRRSRGRRVRAVAAQVAARPVAVAIDPPVPEVVSVLVTVAGMDGPTLTVHARQVGLPTSATIVTKCGRHHVPAWPPRPTSRRHPRVSTFGSCRAASVPSCAA